MLVHSSEMIIDPQFPNLPEPRDRSHKPPLLHHTPISPPRVRIRLLHGCQQGVLGRSFMSDSCYAQKLLSYRGRRTSGVISTCLTKFDNHEPT